MAAGGDSFRRSTYRLRTLVTAYRWRASQCIYEAKAKKFTRRSKVFMNEAILSVNLRVVMNLSRRLVSTYGRRHSTNGHCSPETPSPRSFQRLIPSLTRKCLDEIGGSYVFVAKTRSLTVDALCVSDQSPPYAR